MSDSFIKLANPGKENSLFLPELEEILQDVLHGGRYILGEQVSLFEKNFAAYNDAEHCVGVASGTDALIIALKALGCRAKDKIVTVPNAGFYSSAAIHALGAEPVYVDICEETMAMSVESLKRVLAEEDSIKCVIVTHLYGAMVDIDKVAGLVNGHKIPLLEDCSQAHGAKYNGKAAGTFGAAGVFSFYPTKNLGAIGDGGAIITNNDSVYDSAVKLRQYGWADKYQVTLAGGQNSRLDEIQAAVLNFKLTKLDDLNTARKTVVSRYTEIAFKHLKVFNIDGSNFVAHLAIVRTQHRDKLREFLVANNIGCDVHFPILDYQQPANKLEDVVCSNAERVVNEILSIPCHPTLTEDEITYVIAKLREFDNTL